MCEINVREMQLEWCGNKAFVRPQMLMYVMQWSFCSSFYSDGGFFAPPALQFASILIPCARWPLFIAHNQINNLNKL